MLAEVLFYHFKFKNIKNMSNFKPMLFSTPMVQAILDGRKTQTRRIIKNEVNGFKKKVTKSSIPYCKIFDIIWCRETFNTNYNNTGFIYKADYKEPAKNKQFWKPSLFMPKSACRLFLEVTDVRMERLHDISESDATAEGVEIIHYAEPTIPIYRNYLLKEKLGTTNPILSYQTLWQKINGVNSWQENPFVLVYSFKVVECPQNFC